MNENTPLLAKMKVMSLKTVLAFRNMIANIKTPYKIAKIINQNHPVREWQRDDSLVKDKWILLLSKFYVAKIEMIQWNKIDYDKALLNYMLQIQGFIEEDNKQLT